MSMTTPNESDWRRCAVRLLSAGIGGAVAGPLGVALGHLLGSLISNEAAGVLDSLAAGAGNTVANIAANYCYDQLCNLPPAPDLEDVVRESLRMALGAVRRPDFQDWFDNWDHRLRLPDRLQPDAVFEVRDRLVSTSAGETPAEREVLLENLLKRTLERLDGEARLARSGSISIVGAFRDIEPVLLAFLTQRLPTALETSFEDVITRPENERAFKRVMFRAVRARAMFQKQLTAAVERGDLSSSRAHEASIEEYTRNAAGLIEGGQADPAFIALVQQGDLESAVRL